MDPGRARLMYGSNLKQVVYSKITTSMKSLPLSSVHNELSTTSKQLASLTESFCSTLLKYGNNYQMAL